MPKYSCDVTFVTGTDDVSGTTGEPTGECNLNIITKYITHQLLHKIDIIITVILCFSIFPSSGIVNVLSFNQWLLQMC